MKIIKGVIKDTIMIIDEALHGFTNIESKYHQEIYDSMRYSLFTGGKRLRPIIAVKTFEMYTKEIGRILPYAAGIEMIHTYSLIHDDLPAMDDDDMRRGKPTNHKVFGEGFAILSGDGLLNLAFENMLATTYKTCNSFEEYRKYVRAIWEISKCSGCGGMIGGQAIDLSNEFKKSDENKLISMYEAKTSRLIEAATVAGAIIGGASDKEVQALRNFGKYLGLAYQIRDDILDNKEDTSIEKFTYLNYHSIDEAKKEVNRLSELAIESIKQLKDKDISYFVDLTEELSVRDI